LLNRYLADVEPHYRPMEEPGFYRHLMRFTIWFTVTPVLVHIFNYVDRLTLQRLMTSSEQGVYSAAVNVSGTIYAIGLAVNNVIFPFINTAWEQGARDKALADLDLAIRSVAVALTVAGLGLILLGRPVIRILLGDAYLAGADVLPFLVVFNVLTTSVWLFGIYASLVEKTYVSAIGLAFALPVNVALNLLLIPRMGLSGAGLATMLSYGLLWATVVNLCAKLGMRLSWKTVTASLFPLLLLLPAPGAAVAVGLVVVVCLSTDWIITHGQRRRITAEVSAFLRRKRASAGSPEPPDDSSLP
jgi:O-antigen/teichoic acid export membrane protein